VEAETCCLAFGLVGTIHRCAGGAPWRLRTSNAMQPPSPPPRLMRTPTWAARVLQFTFALTLLLVAAFFVPGWKCNLAYPLVGVFGLAWLLFCVFALWFSWPLPRRGGRGFYSPTSKRPIGLVFCFGMMAVGTACLLASFGYIPAPVKGCA
jgi:hypothetical protein